MAKDVGVPLEKGSRVIMQVHYNLLAGPRPDVSSAQLRLAPGDAEAGAARDDAAAGAGRAALPPGPQPVPALRPDDRGGRRPGALRGGGRADRQLPAPALRADPGRARAVVRPAACSGRRRSGRPPATCTCSAARSRSRSTRARRRRRTVLDIPVWDFDNQGAKPVKPVAPEARGHGAGDLPARPVAARPAAGVRGPARAVRRVGRGHHRRDVPRASCWSRAPERSGHLPPRAGRRSHAAIATSITQATIAVGQLAGVERGGDRDHAGVVAPAVDAHPLGVRREGVARQEVLGLDELVPRRRRGAQARRTPACRHSRPRPVGGPSGNALAPDGDDSRKLGSQPGRAHRAQSGRSAPAPPMTQPDTGTDTGRRDRRHTVVVPNSIPWWPSSAPATSTSR